MGYDHALEIDGFENVAGLDAGGKLVGEACECGFGFAGEEDIFRIQAVFVGVLRDVPFAFGGDRALGESAVASEAAICAGVRRKRICFRFYCRGRWGWVRGAFGLSC